MGFLLPYAGKMGLGIALKMGLAVTALGLVTWFYQSAIASGRKAVILDQIQQEQAHKDKVVKDLRKINKASDERYVSALDRVNELEKTTEEANKRAQDAINTLMAAKKDTDEKVEQHCDPTTPLPIEFRDKK